MMSYKKPFLIVFTALVLACSIPVSACAFGQFSITDERLQYYEYRDVHIPTKSGSAWWHCYGSRRSSNSSNSWESCGYIHVGSCHKAFIFWIPFMGWYLVSLQGAELHADLSTSDHSASATLRCGLSTSAQPNYYQDAVTWYGNGILSSQNIGLFQTNILGTWVIFYRIQNSDLQSMPSTKASGSGLTTPSSDEEDAIKQFISDNSGSGQPFPALNPADITYIGSDSIDSVVTYPNGEVVPTDSSGNPVVTYPNGETAYTNKYGYAEQTYPDGTPVQSYVDSQGKIHYVPWDSDTLKPYGTIIYNGDTYIIPPGYQAVTDSDTGQVLPSPENPSQPWIEEITIYNAENGKSEVNEEFSKLYDMISDMDDLSSIMESNQGVMSGHVDSVRSLVDDVTSWFPAPVVACMVCGAIMIIAVKITGSGKS